MPQNNKLAGKKRVLRRVCDKPTGSMFPARAPKLRGYPSFFGHGSFAEMRWVITKAVVRGSRTLQLQRQVFHVFTPPDIAICA